MTRSRAAELLEKLARIVPGVSGYQDRELRRAHDRDVRQKAADEVALCRGELSRRMSDLSRLGAGGLAQVGGCDRVATRLERLEDELRYAAYGYAGWFDRTGVVLQDLERLYEYDLSLLDAAAALRDILPTGGGGTPAGFLPTLQEAVDGLQTACDGRRKVLEKEG